MVGINELASALNKVQAEVENVKKNKANPFHKSKYADLQGVWDAIREPLTKHGLSIIQLPCEAPEGHVGLRTIILHVSGQSIEDKFAMPLKDPTNPQAAGAALTYARRYALMAAVGIAPEDDDGNLAASAGGASGKTRSEPEQPKGAGLPVDYVSIATGLRNRFDSGVSIDAKKGIYMEVKNSALPVETKNKMLADMAAVIKELSKVKQ